MLGANDIHNQTLNTIYDMKIFNTVLENTYNREYCLIFMF